MESTSHRYQWTEEERRLLRESGLVLTPTRRLNFEGRVWHGTLDGKAYVVRAIPQQEGSQEVIALKTLLSQPNNPRNHTVPAKIHSGPNAHLLIMPFFTPVDIFISTTPPLHILLKMIRQIIEGVTYMHELHIAHVDVAIPNIVVPDSMFAGTPPLIYFIDFGSSRALDAPPEHMHALERYHEFAGHFELPESPDGPVIMNPYEYDVYSVGWTIATIVATYTSGRHLPPCIADFGASLQTVGFPRPTIVHVGRAFRVMSIWATVTQVLYFILPRPYADSAVSRGWKIIARRVLDWHYQ